MMNINEQYKKQTDRFCEANCMITAEDILAKAKQRQNNITNETATDIKESQNKSGAKITPINTKKTMFRLSHVAAACLAIFLLTGTTILAFSGRIDNVFGDAGRTVIAFDETKMELFFRDILGDETTAELAGKGYFYEINQVEEDENFRIDVIAASGDVDNAKLAVDVYVKDDKLAAANERIYLVCYMANPGEEVVKDPNGCRVTGGYGIKDKSVDNLYHVLLDIDSNHSETVYHFTTVITTFASDENVDLFAFDWLPYLERDPFWRFHATDICSHITIPEEAYIELPTRRYREVSYHGPTYEYHLDSVEYGYYEMRLNFHFNYESDFTPSNESGQMAHERYMVTEFYNMLQDAALVIDGKEYKYPEDKVIPYAQCFFSEEEGASDLCNFAICFPATDYFEADSILLRIGDETYDLKESK